MERGTHTNTVGTVRWESMSRVKRSQQCHNVQCVRKRQQSRECNCDSHSRFKSQCTNEKQTELYFACLKSHRKVAKKVKQIENRWNSEEGSPRHWADPIGASHDSRAYGHVRTETALMNHRGTKQGTQWLINVPMSLKGGSEKASCHDSEAEKVQGTNAARQVGLNMYMSRRLQQRELAQTKHRQTKRGRTQTERGLRGGGGGEACDSRRMRHENAHRRPYDTDEGGFH